MLELTASVVTVLIGLISAIFGELARIRKRKKVREETLEEKIAKLTASLKDATNFINNIEVEIKTRGALIEKLKNDERIYKELAELKRSEVEAIAQVFRGQLIEISKGSFWKGFAVNFVFFILGAGVTLLTTVLIK